MPMDNYVQLHQYILQVALWIEAVWREEKGAIFFFIFLFSHHETSTLFMIAYMFSTPIHYLFPSTKHLSHSFYLCIVSNSFFMMPNGQNRKQGDLLTLRELCQGGLKSLLRTIVGKWPNMPLLIPNRRWMATETKEVSLTCVLGLMS